MTISDSRCRELEARGTAGSTLAKTALLSLVLVLAQYAAPLRELDLSRVQLIRTAGTVSEPSSLQINEMDIFEQINRVYDDLLVNQVELDAESKRVLYANLWDLYT